MRGHTLD